MLVARGAATIGRGSLAWAVSFGGRVWSVLVERDGLTLDTRFVPPIEAAPKPNACVYLLLGGAFETFGAAKVRHVAPCAFVLREEDLDGGRGARNMPFRAGGSPYRAIELHLAAGDVRFAPSPMPLDAPTRAAANRACALSSHDGDEPFASAMTELLGCLAREGAIAHRAVAAALAPTPAPFARLWTALRPMVERLYLAPTIQEVSDATGVSGRQIDRYVRDFVTAFGMVGAGWRPATRHLRLKLSVLLLSADGASVSDVARAVGYGSTDAMARAFRDARMPAPSAVQEALRRAAELAPPEEP